MFDILYETTDGVYISLYFGGMRHLKIIPLACQNRKNFVKTFCSKLFKNFPELTCNKLWKNKTSLKPGYSSVPFFSADTYGGVFQLGGIFLAVPGTSFFGGTDSVVPGTAKWGGNFLAVMKYGGADFGGSRYYFEIWR